MTETALITSRLLSVGGSPVQDPELVYSPSSPHSYYRDFLARETGKIDSPGHQDRLTRHAEQMERLYRDYEAGAYARAQGHLEFRVQPGRNDGYGGYFSPPAWLNELFAGANRPGRVLSGLMARFPLPSGVSSVNVPVIANGGTIAQPATDDAPAAGQDITDAAASSQVVPIWGQADISLQLLEQSPPGAYMDWVIFTDLTEAYDYDLEQQLLYGGQALGSVVSQLTGITQTSGIVVVSATGAATGSNVWPFLGKVAAQVGDGRGMPPECWLMRSARWFWFQSAEDTATRPFGLSSAFYLGSDPDTPNPIGGLQGLPVFLDDAIPATLGTGGNQDEIIALRPTDSILLEGAPQTIIDRESLSGSLGLRLQLHANVAAITSRRPAGIGVVSGTALAVQSGY